MTYEATAPRPPSGWGDDLTTINTNGATHIEDTNGDFWEISTINRKSVSINQANVPNKTRVTSTQVASFGTMATTPNHTERAHALLSASGAHRWLHCTPSPHLEARYPDTSSDAADQGTAAHELAEYKLRNLLGENPTRPHSHWIDEEMEDHTDNYADHVIAELVRTKEDSPAAFCSIEERLDFSHIVPDGFGTGDAIIVGDNTMTIVDFKYGKGVKVDAENNPQMSLYALGALAAYGMIYNIQQVRMVIFQPRIDNISVWETTPEHLYDWAKDVVEPQARLAEAGEGQLTAGDWCTFCKHAAQCPALAAQYLNPIPTREDNTPTAPDPDTLTDQQISQIITHSKDLKKWLTKVEEHALTQAQQGRRYPGLKVVEGRSVRRYADEAAVAEAVEATGNDPWQRKVLGITAMTKLLGKKQFEELLGEHIIKPEGAPTLVPVSDKRPELTVATPDNVFQPIEQGA
ncbi:DUF2800 domain-containing protein [Corynebacterium macclintockiae]|uniref:DUF2800 domain-containing protein n=1 Tax=Corynebacterium macclintockiae TaxID=2913501 RepID=UPI003EBD108F